MMAKDGSWWSMLLRWWALWWLMMVKCVCAMVAERLVLANHGNWWGNLGLEPWEPPSESTATGNSPCSVRHPNRLCNNFVENTAAAVRNDVVHQHMFYYKTQQESNVLIINSNNCIPILCQIIVHIFSTKPFNASHEALRVGFRNHLCPYLETCKSWSAHSMTFVGGTWLWVPCTLAVHITSMTRIE